MRMHVEHILNIQTAIFCIIIQNCHLILSASFYQNAYVICYDTRETRKRLITKSGSISTKKCLGSGEKIRVGRGTGNTQLIYLGLIPKRSIGPKFTSTLFPCFDNHPFITTSYKCRVTPSLQYVCILVRHFTKLSR